MEKLLLVNFEKDSDSIYVGFEPQVFDDNINGQGHLILGWRKDKKVDVYHQKSLKPDPLKYNIAGAGLNKMIPTDMEKAFFDINEYGVQAEYRFKDIADRQIEISVHEKNRAKRKPFGLLAPMGDSATQPGSMPMVLLHDFYFIRRNETEFSLTIDNRGHQLDDLPLPMDWQKMTFARYSPKPLIATLNPEFTGVLKCIEIPIGQESIEIDNQLYELEWISQKVSIRSLTVKNDIHPLTISFSPAFPDLNNFSSETPISGNLIISGHQSIGSISGNYTIHSDLESLQLSVIPSKGWKPRTTKLSTWFLFHVVKVFKKWPTTYRWDANFKKGSDTQWQMESKWIRTGKILKD
ncbi:MAG: hypothetical protein EA362_10405 [Saprospirales bacterium]|nr:MAG: hypothetical protein EA362_10405 [Saprospirales bacterium]